MDHVSRMRIRACETAFSHNRCNTCERQGLPMLPLRRALVPKPPGWYGQATPELANLQLGVRILRGGYLYVLLDRKVWQAYQVTPDGYLRQIDPYRRPVANDDLLNRLCVNADHDIPAAFLTIDSCQYKRAELAFANDPWSTQTLDRYKAGQGIERMQAVDLATVRDSPASAGIAMTADLPQVHDQVHDYQAYEPLFRSVHGFHTRANRRLPLRHYLREAMASHGLARGVLAIVLDDPVGLVQEYNAQRASWALARQVWSEEPERAYQQQTSRILLAIRALHREWAQSRVASFEPVSGDGPPVFVSPEVERQRVIDQLTMDSDKRLEARYDEPGRAAFQASYDARLERYQEQIDHYGALYAEAFEHEHFKRIERYDYERDDLISAIAYTRMMCSCLRGGISEAPGSNDGATTQLWHRLLTDPAGPVYKALLLSDGNLLSTLLPLFDASGSIDWQDRSRLYTLLTKAVTDPEIELLRRAHLQDAIAQLLAALNSAGERLKDALGPGIRLAVSRLNVASQYLYNDVRLTELRVQMKLGEYYALQSEHLRNLQGKLANGVDRAIGGTREKARPLILGGLLSLSVMDPRIADRLIQVTVWVEGSLEELQRSLLVPAGSFSPVQGAPNHWLPGAVGVGTLDRQARQWLAGFKVSAAQGKTWIRNGFAGLRGMAGSADLLTSIGALYLMNDALGKNLEAVEQATGDKSMDARLALQGSALAVLGGGIEVVGAALHSGAKGLSAGGMLSVRGARIADASVRAGELMARTGAVIVAATGLFDAVQAALGVARGVQQGNASVAKLYGLALWFSGAGGVLGISAAFYGATALAGPLGIAIVSALIGYGLYQWAASEEASPLESWAGRCYFGLATETPRIHWASSDDAVLALAELNAIIMGMEAGIRLQYRITDSGTIHPGGIGRIRLPTSVPSWQYLVRLPYFDANRSAYLWSFKVHRWNDWASGRYVAGEVAVRGSHCPPSLTGNLIEHLTRSSEYTRHGQSDYREVLATETTTGFIELADQRNVELMQIKGEIELLSYSSGHDIQACTFALLYWPDRYIEDGYAFICVKGGLV